MQNIFYRHFDLPVNDPVIGLLGNSWRITHVENPSLHFHNCLEIGYYTEGTFDFYLRDERISVTAPAVIIAPANAPHISNPPKGTEYRGKWIYLDPELLCGHLPTNLLLDLSRAQYHASAADCVFRQDEYPQVYELLHLIIGEMEAKAANSQMIVRELLTAFLLLLMRLRPCPSPKTRTEDKNIVSLRPAVAAISQHYMDQLDVDDLAEQCHLSTTHFRRLFKSTFGFSPLDYIQVVRIQRACAMLYGENLSVLEVGARVGFPSPSSFGRQFKKIRGISPSQWRKRIHAVDNPLVNTYLNSLPPADHQLLPQEYLDQLNAMHRMPGKPLTAEKGEA